MPAEYKEGQSKVAVSSLVKIPPSKKSCPERNSSDLSLSSNGGNPHIKTCRKKRHTNYADIIVKMSEEQIYLIVDIKSTSTSPRTTEKIIKTQAFIYRFKNARKHLKTEVKVVHSFAISNLQVINRQACWNLKQFFFTRHVYSKENIG